MDHSSKSYHFKTKTNKRPDIISLGLVAASSMRDRPIHHGRAQLWEPGWGTIALVNKAAVQKGLGLHVFKFNTNVVTDKSMTEELNMELWLAILAQGGGSGLLPHQE